MRRLAAILLAVAGAGLALGEDKKGAWEPAKTYAFMAGILEWSDPSLARFPKEGRKDRELEAVLEKDGVPKDHVVFLEDAAATHEAMHRELAKLAAAAGEGSTLVFYFAGHGLTDAGETYFANYDVDLKNEKESAFGMGELEKILDESFRGSRVLLMADCCHSGALAGVVHHHDKSERVRAACLTSTAASNVSTGHWTFTESIIAAFSGDGAIDANHDQTLTFGEVDAYVHDEMHFREEQLTHGARTPSFDESFVIRTVDPARAVPAVEGKWQLKAYCEVEWKEAWYCAQVLGVKDGKYKVHYLGFGDSWDEWVALARMRTPPVSPGTVGQEVDVEWDKKFYPAKIVKIEDGAFYFIHYDGYGPEWDEWVTKKRVRFERAKK